MNGKYSLTYSIFGASHAEEIGVSLEGVPFGERIDLAELQAFADRRKPVSSEYSTSRREPDEIIIECGIENGVTTGGEIIAKIKNASVKRSDYSNLKYCPRPSHADYAAYMKYGIEYDMSGGGKFSGRMTAPMCIAGGIALQLLKKEGIEIGAYIQSIGSVCGEGYRFRNIEKAEVLSCRRDSFPVLDKSFLPAMQREISAAASLGDSCGGVVECCIFGVPAGLGNVGTESIESEIARNIFAIPAVKGVEFGSGFALSEMRGSGANDEFFYDGETVKTTTNNNGGINGGLSNGMPITFRVAVKPTPSISKEQKTVNLKTGENVTVSVKGRHDACIVPRVVPVVEAMAALAVINMNV